MKNLKEILRFFEKIFKFYRNFRENLGKNLEFWKYAFVGGSGRGAPKANEIIKNLVEKSMETCRLLKIFMNYATIF